MLQAGTKLLVEGRPLVVVLLSYQELDDSFRTTKQDHKIRKGSILV